jgi:hypothetical protein
VTAPEGREKLQAGHEGVPTEFVENEAVDPQQPGMVYDAEVAEIIEETQLVVQQAHAIVITNDDDYAAAGEFLTKEIKAALRAVKEAFDPIVTAAHQAHRAATQKRKEHQEPLLEAERIVKAAMGTYHQAQVAARRKLEQERLDAARREAEARQLEEAARLENEGREEAAEARLEEPVIPTMPTPVEPEKPKAEGVSVRMVTKWRVVSINNISAKFLMPDKKKIDQTVSAMGKDAEEIIGGIEVYEEPSVAARAS